MHDTTKLTVAVSLQLAVFAAGIQGNGGVALFVGAASVLLMFLAIASEVL